MDFDGVRYEFPHKNVIYWMKVAHKNVKIIKPIAIYIFIAGMIVISAMFLPRISDSTLLLIFGLYLPVISGIKELLHMHFAAFPALGCSLWEAERVL